MSDKNVNEKDKPFILALVASAIVVLNIVVAAYGAFKGNVPMTEAGMECLKFSFPLTMMSWAFYFKK